MSHFHGVVKMESNGPRDLVAGLGLDQYPKLYYLDSAGDVDESRPWVVLSLKGS